MTAGPMHDGPMHDGLVEEILAFIEEGDIWIDGRLPALVAALRSDQHNDTDLAATLADGLGALVERQAGGRVPLRLRSDLEAVVYPRLWKLVEGIKDDVTEGELVNRVNALRRGLDRVLADDFTG